MNMLRKLMEQLNRVWYEKSRISPAITIRKGTGLHKLVTVKSGVLCFHSLTYSEQLGSSQEVILEDMTINELVTVVQGMGYDVTVNSGAINLGIPTESALVLLEVDNRSLVDGETLYAFTSAMWKVMYPIHRQLVASGGDVDKAVEQILLPSARGEWLDYWVGFFKIKRLPDEPDEMLLRRAFMSLTSVKANDVAIEELVGYYIDAKVSVLDHLPSVFKVRVSPEYMDTAKKVKDLINTLKGASVDYILNYATSFDESYSNAFRDGKGQTFKDINASYSKALIDFGTLEEDYSVIPAERALNGFVLDDSKLNSAQRLSVSDKRIVITVRMVMTQGGTVIQEM